MVIKLKVNDLIFLDSVYNNQKEISDIVANLRFPQKYIILEHGGRLYELDLVSVDDQVFTLRIAGEVKYG